MNRPLADLTPSWCIMFMSLIRTPCATAFKSPRFYRTSTGGVQAIDGWFGKQPGPALCHASRNRGSLIKVVNQALSHRARATHLTLLQNGIGQVAQRLKTDDHYYPIQPGPEPEQPSQQ